ncbi:HAD hydrolase-like protein [Lentzea sp. NPDC006480]|uniref:HAD family hydrolase n=1 Tax=Lentzea sp. NPDC006480 TaxID=3157176 RepID=UPI0033B79663
MGFDQSDDEGRCVRSLLATSDALLLDFDGPICSVFAGYPASIVANQLRDVLLHGGHTELPTEVEKTDDPFELFKYAGMLGHDEAHYIEAALRAYEVEAIATAEPTPGAHDLIHGWVAGGRSLAVVSNNSAEAVESYIHRQKLPYQDILIAARESADPQLLKPNPYLIKSGIGKLGCSSSSSLLVGDSVTDIFAASAANVRSIGYANKPGKRAQLDEAGADAVVESMEKLLRSIGP